MKRVYLAGPDVFRRDAAEVGERLKQICRDHGLEGAYPLDNELAAETDAAGAGGVQTGLRISAANERLLRSCDAVLANLTPFRGPSVDPGTAFEVGYARALGKLIVGYSEDDRDFLVRTREWVLSRGGTVAEDGAGAWDGDGHRIEDFALPENLMIPGAIASSGGVLVLRKDVEGTGRSLVEYAVEQLARRLDE